jgi:hypothetical protein
VLIGMRCTRSVGGFPQLCTSSPYFCALHNTRIGKSCIQPLSFEPISMVSVQKVPCPLPNLRRSTHHTTLNPAFAASHCTVCCTGAQALSFESYALNTSSFDAFLADTPYPYDVLILPENERCVRFTWRVRWLFVPLFAALSRSSQSCMAGLLRCRRLAQARIHDLPSARAEPAAAGRLCDKVRRHRRDLLADTQPMVMRGCICCCCAAVAR